MEHSFVEAIDARENIYYVNRGGGHVCKKIVLSAVAALLITAANLNLCCSVLVNGREVPGFYSPTRADILSGIAYEAACELLPDTPELPLVQRRYSLSLHAPENDGAALTDAMAEFARNYGGMTAVEFTGKHYDMGNKLGVMQAQVETALRHPEIGGEFRAYLKELAATL